MTLSRWAAAAAPAARVSISGTEQLLPPPWWKERLFGPERKLGRTDVQQQSSRSVGRSVGRPPSGGRHCAEDGP